MSPKTTPWSFVFLASLAAAGVACSGEEELSADEGVSEEELKAAPAAELPAGILCKSGGNSIRVTPLGPGRVAVELRKANSLADDNNYGGLKRISGGRYFVRDAQSGTQITVGGASTGSDGQVTVSYKSAITNNSVSFANGTCSLQRAIGAGALCEVSGSSEGTCAKGLVCAPKDGSDDRLKSCQRPIAKGGLCEVSNSYEGPCAAGLICAPKDGSDERLKSCQTPIAKGGLCEVSSSYEGPCAAGLICAPKDGADERLQSCQKPVAEGGLCEVSDSYEGPCAKGLKCAPKDGDARLKSCQRK